MKTILLFLFTCGLLSLPAVSQNQAAPTLYSQLCELNVQWKKKSIIDYPELMERKHVVSNVELIQLHLSLVEKTLREKQLTALSRTQGKLREEGLDILHNYMVVGVFPINNVKPYLTPIFIDRMNTACAVGHIMIETGFGKIARKIDRQNELGYVYQLDKLYPELRIWANKYGFTVDELAWIQPTYGSGCLMQSTPVLFHPTCPGDYDGMIILEDPGTVPPYIIGGAGCQFLSAGTYQYMILDGLGDTIYPRNTCFSSQLSYR